MGELVRCDIDGSVATITLDSPANRNALSTALVRDLHEALDAAEEAEPRAIVLTHTGPAFCAGADLKERASGPIDSAPMVRAMQRLGDAAAPTIAAVNGAVRAGGIGLMAACDLVVVASSTTFAFTEVRIGVAPAIISVPILRRVAPAALTAPFLTGSTFDAAQAKAMHLVDVVAVDTPGGVAAAVDRLVDGLLASAPNAVRAAREVLASVPGMLTKDRTAAYAAMQQLSEAMFVSADAVEGMAAFREGRAPSWRVERQPDAGGGA